MCVRLSGFREAFEENMADVEAALIENTTERLFDALINNPLHRIKIPPRV